jgi:gliding motility-associated-like protein
MPLIEAKICLNFMKSYFLLLLCVCQSLWLFPQGMGTKVFNFSSFTQDKKANSAILDKHSSAEAKKHPEYGILPFNAQCRECVELIDKRTMYSRFFIDPLRATHTYSQQSYYPLHYHDKDGQWRTIDHRLRPALGQTGVYIAPLQPLPVRFDFNAGYTSIDLHSFQLIYNHDLKMYYVNDKNDVAVAGKKADYTQYKAGYDGARVYNMWPGVDMECFAKEGKIETNFIIVSRPNMPISKGYMVIEDHVSAPDGYTLKKMGSDRSLLDEDLLLRDKSGNIRARMEHVRIANADNMAVVTGYTVQKEPGGFSIRMLVPCSFLTADASSYPIVVDPIVTGFDSLGNFNSSGLPSANMDFTSLPGHCDYHMTVTVPGMSQLQAGYVDLEASTTSNPACGDTTFGNLHGHECLKREILFRLRCDTCNQTELYSCFNSTNCDTPGTLSTDPLVVAHGGPIPTPASFLSCLPPQCPDYQLGFTLMNSDSSCEDVCGQLCAKGNRWAMTIEACQIDAYLTTTDSNVCEGQYTTITCIPSCGVPPYHYLWSTGDTTQSITISPPAVGVDVACTAYDACNNPVVNAPDILINQIPSPTADAGADGKLCEGGTVSLGGSPTTTGSNTITWSASSAQALSWISDTTAANPTVTIPMGTMDTTFYVVRTFDGTCFTLDTAFVYSLPDPVAAIDTSGSTKICNGQSVTLNANGPFSSYLWSTGSTAQSITVSSPGSYYVIVTDNNNCRDTSSSVTISQIQIANIHVYPDTTIFYGDSVQLFADISLSPPAVDSFFWSPADSSISCLRCPGPTVAPLSAEAYYLTVYTQGCVLSDSTYISVILPDKYYIPDAFTPNGDGINDNFFLYGQSGVTVHSFKVFDRWGEKVYDGLFPWDGTYRGQACTPGIYVYIFSIGLFGHLQDDVRKGSITLIR